MTHLCYKLKLAPAHKPQIYRVLEIDGNRTFEDLSDAILDAFEFDHSHLYMFSRSGKPYDSNGIYHPMSDGKSLANEVHLRDVKLVLRNKYLFLYDFGDEWMFYVTVIGIRECDQEMPITILQSHGERANVRIGMMMTQRNGMNFTKRKIVSRPKRTSFTGRERNLLKKKNQMRILAA